MELKNRKLNRLRGRDYSLDGWYFVTICTDDRINYFGGVRNGRMCVNKLGSIVWRHGKYSRIHYSQSRRMVAGSKQSTRVMDVI